MSIDELGGDEVSRVVAADLENGDDVGMIQREGGAGLLLESAQSILIGCELSREQLEGDLAAEARVLREINHSHSAGAEFRRNLVRPNRPADQRFSSRILHKFRGRFEHRRFDEAAGLLVRVDQRLNFASQRLIIRAGVIEEGGAIRCATLDRGLKDAIDLFPAFGLHSFESCPPFISGNRGSTLRPRSARRARWPVVCRHPTNSTSKCNRTEKWLAILALRRLSAAPRCSTRYGACQRK